MSTRSIKMLILVLLIIVYLLTAWLWENPFPSHVPPVEPLGDSQSYCGPNSDQRDCDAKELRP